MSARRQADVQVEATIEALARDVIAVGGNTVSMLLGDGGGDFAAGTAYRVGDNAFSLAVGDLTGDGVPA